MVNQPGPSRSRPVSGPVSRNESPGSGPSSSKQIPRSLPQSRNPSHPPSKWNTPQERSPVISSSSSDAEDPSSKESDKDSDPALPPAETRSGAPSENGSAPSDPEDSEEESEEEEEEEDGLDEEPNPEKDEDEDEDSDDAEDSSEEVDKMLHDPARVDVADLCRKGGDSKNLTARQIRKLISMAIPPVEGEKVPPLNVREWTFRDIASLPRAERKEWFTACHEELEALRARDVYDLVDRPKGRKVIKNRWVFDVKTDGRKKARLVAKGFSQVEGEDFDKIFSPVV